MVFTFSHSLYSAVLRSHNLSVWYVRMCILLTTPCPCFALFYFVLFRKQLDERLPPSHNWVTSRWQPDRRHSSKHGWHYASYFTPISRLIPRQVRIADGPYESKWHSKRIASDFVRTRRWVRIYEGPPGTHALVLSHMYDMPVFELQGIVDNMAQHVADLYIPAPPPPLNSVLTAPRNTMVKEKNYGYPEDRERNKAAFSSTASSYSSFTVSPPLSPLSPVAAPSKLKAHGKSHSGSEVLTKSMKLKSGDKKKKRSRRASSASAIQMHVNSDDDVDV